MSSTRRSRARGAEVRAALWAATVLAAAIGATGAVRALASSARPVVVGSKAFTESVILGEIVTQTLEREGIPAVHRRALGGSRVLFDALRAGQIDVYPEYTGTLDEELLGGSAQPAAGDPAKQPGASARTAKLRGLGLTVAARFGFEDRYVLGMLPGTARRLGIQRISDLARTPGLRFGLSNEFLSRADGWLGLERAYGLGGSNVQGLDHELAYRALEHGDIDVMDLYSTDPQIVRDRLTVLADDRGFFPHYSAILLARATLPAEVRRALASLAGRIDTQTMARMNERVLIGHRAESQVAAEFVARQFGGSAQTPPRTWLQELGRYTLQQLALTCASLAAAILIGLPLGIVAARRPGLSRVVLGAAGVVQTIPSLALLVFMIPLLGIGFAPAALALFLYSLLPIIRGTCAGLAGIPRPLAESAAALGLTGSARLRRVELPLAARSILAGIKTAAVINIGTATLGALIGAGGYGQPILTGIRLNDTGLILEGAVPAALLALAVQGLFDGIERLLMNPSTFSRSKR
ncbi:MAG: glycine betaine ABC transporter substrate-binding protein [Steroidobacteraceae bacterium]